MGYDFGIDDLDFFIVSEIQNADVSKKEITTWDIAKNFLKKQQQPFNSKNHEHKETNRCAKNIRKRLEKMGSWGVVCIHKDDNDRKNRYSIILDNCKVCKHKFPDGYFDSFIFKINGSWVVFQIS